MYLRREADEIEVFGRMYLRGKDEFYGSEENYGKENFFYGNEEDFGDHYPIMFLQHTRIYYFRQIYGRIVTRAHLLFRQSFGRYIPYAHILFSSRMVDVAQNYGKFVP